MIIIIIYYYYARVDSHSKGMVCSLLAVDFNTKATSEGYVPGMDMWLLHEHTRNQRGSGSVERE